MKSIHLIAAVAALLSLCASRADERPAGCDVSDLRAVFEAPLTYDGKVFCGRAYMVTHSRSVWFYPSPTEAKQAPYETVLLPANELPEALSFAGGDGFVVVHGKLEVYRECLEVPAPGEVIKCVPVRKPIFITLTYGRVANF
jgi:hypothetical protein